jgi:voltage-gated potassium channel
MQADAMSDRAAWRRELYRIIFQHDTRGGKLFDVALIVSIVASVIAVMLDTVESIHATSGDLLYAAEWGFTVLFTAEYVLRLLCARNAGRYARSFFGIVDLLAILPTYVSVLIPGSQYLLVIRILRVLRVYRVLKLVKYVGEADTLMTAMRESRRKITVFLLAVLVLAVILGSVMYIIEGEQSGFTSIPRSVYWTIVTLTTVGYGDISPQTNLGQTVAAVIMMLGYSIIAVPTGIVTIELSRARERRPPPRRCPDCGEVGHDPDAVHCKFCGERLERGAGGYASSGASRPI